MIVALARVRRDQRGQSLVETALTVPLLIMTLLGAYDGARTLHAGVVVQSASLAGAQYGALSSQNASDSAGIDAAVRNETRLPEASGTNPTVTSSTATDGAGELRVVVRATFTMNTLFRYPGLPASFTITRETSLQVRR